MDTGINIQHLMAVFTSVAHALKHGKSHGSAASTIYFVDNLGRSANGDAATSTDFSSEGEEDLRNQPRTLLAGLPLASPILLDSATNFERATDVTNVIFLIYRILT